ncbi:hypothetical protein ACFSSC_09010 [Corynebacterium mendelii]|uniref:Lipoprotein n=1 Tax=Corynebacterium mendelii TaxID=2765362 RepID=A0A939E188_9CORY|nr:hypothetical protein [Corynebacterium mendelii]MBN9645115.1 hypothetical protein [Corynebacterium mendelii]
MTRRVLLSLPFIAACATALAACGLPGTGPDPQPTVVTVTATAPAPAHGTGSPAPAPSAGAGSPHAPATAARKTGVAPTTATDGNNLRQLYESLLGNPTSIPFTPPDDQPLVRNGEYEYALADVDGDGLLDMMVRIGVYDTDSNWNEVPYATVVLGTSTADTIDTATGLILAGMGDVGSFQASAMIPQPGHTGVVELQYSGTLPDFSITEFSLDATRTLVKEREYSVTVTDNRWGLPEIPGYCVPAWLPASDQSQVAAMAPSPCMTWDN